MIFTRETDKETGDGWRGSIFSCGEYTATLVARITEDTSLLLRPSKTDIFCYFLGVVYSVLNNVFEALHLFLICARS
jgi:hypothetical protein